MSTFNTGYSSFPKTYNDYQYELAHKIVFGRRHSDPSAPQGSVNTRAYDSTDKLWTGTSGTCDPKPDQFPTIEEPDDWRHQALPRTTVAVRDDEGKRDWSLMPWECIEEINKVLEFGARKYSCQNWRNGNGFSWTRVLSSLLRHTFSWARGEDLDKESGLSHLAHMGCNVIFLIYYTKYKDRYNIDDRVVL
jgi:hypothetical protein